MSGTSSQERAVAEGAAIRASGSGLILLALAALLMLADGSDMAAMPLAVPHIALDLDRSAGAFGPALSAMPLGFGLGALFIGPLGDRHGRRLLVIGSILLVALATAATGAATSLPHFVICRILVGAGLGACLTNLNALVAEVTPPAFRARALTFISAGIPLGAAGAGFLMPAMIVWGGGWRGAFLLLAGGIAAVALVNLVWLPESPTIRAGLAGKPASRPSAWSLLEPLGKAHRLATFVFVGLYTANACSLYLLQSWLPTILPQAGYSLAQASRLSGIAQIGGLAGGLIIATFVDRAAAVPALVVSYVGVIAAIAVFQMVPPGGLGWVILLLIVGGGISGAHMSIMALGALFYPPHMTATALGLATAVARIGAIAGPLLGQVLVQRGIGAPHFFFALVPLALFCIAVVFLIPAVDRRRGALPD